MSLTLDGPNPPGPEHGTLRYGGLEISDERGLVLADGSALHLSVREYELLSALAHARGRIVPREELYERVWSAPLRDGDRSVDVYVSKLRGKLERAIPDIQFIHTHFGFGYRFEPQATSGSPRT